jgi:hypothetical protein
MEAKEIGEPEETEHLAHGRARKLWRTKKMVREARASWGATPSGPF